MKAIYRFELDNHLAICMNCCGGTIGNSCRHKKVDRFKIFMQVRKDLVKQYGLGNVVQTVVGNSTILTVE